MVSSSVSVHLHCLLWYTICTKILTVFHSKLAGIVRHKLLADCAFAFEKLRDVPVEVLYFKKKPVLREVLTLVEQVAK